MQSESKKKTNFPERKDLSKTNLYLKISKL